MMRTPKRSLPKFNSGVHFLTAKTFKGMPYFEKPSCAGIVCEELERARQMYGFDVLAFVVMPDHVHLLLWWEPESRPGLTISKIAWAVKGRAARGIVRSLLATGGQGEPTDNRGRVGEGSALGPGTASAGPSNPPPRLEPVRDPADRPHRRNWRFQIWQQGAGYDFNIYSPGKLEQKVLYIHKNPVRAGLAPTPDAYPWSSAANYVGSEPGHPVQITWYTELLL